MIETILLSIYASLPTSTGTMIPLFGVGCFAMGCIVATSFSTPFRFTACARSLFLKPDRCDQETNKAKKNGNKNTAAPLAIEALAEILEDFKMVLVVRNDLKMGKGKIAAQCSHATLGIYKKLLRRAPKSLNRWEMCGQVKVVLKSESEEDLLVLQERAKSLQLPTHITIDAGRTQIAPNSRTVMAILGPAEMVDDVTGGLKLF